MEQSGSHGWISLYRKIQENEFYPSNEKRPFTRFEAWIDLLLNTNHSEKKVFLKNKIYTCKRGESLRSLLTLSITWRWSRNRVRRFLELLHKDGAINIVSDSNTTRICIINFEKYQKTDIKKELIKDNKPDNYIGDRNMGETTLDTTLDTTLETQLISNNNDNNDNNDNKLLEAKIANFKKKVFTDEFIEQYGEKMLKAFFSYWSEPNRSNTKMKMDLQQTWKLSGRLAIWQSREVTIKKQDDDRIYRE
jgi:hypothetical protein